MSNSFYNHGAFPSTGSAATSASMRAELDLVAAGFDKMPTLAGNANKFIIVNSTGTALTQTDVLPAFTVTDTDFTVQDDGDNTRKFQFNAGSITTGNTRVYVMPDLDTTLVGTNVTQTLTNKTLTAPVIATIVNTGTLTLPTSTDTLVGRNTTDTLTNKTLTNPVIGTIVNTGTLTLPTSTDTLVGRQTTDTLTNKTISGASNTLSNIANGSLSNSSVVIGSSTLSLGGTLTTLAGVTISGASNTLSNIANASLTNSSITINGSTVALGSSVTVTATATNALTIGNGLSGTSYNGSSAVTIAINTGVTADLSTAQTFSNKTISGSANTLSNIANASLTNSAITIGSTAISLGATSLTLAGLTSASATTLISTGNQATSVAISAIGHSSGTVTVTTSTAHGLTTGDTASIDGVADYTFCGVYTVTVTNANVFTYSQTASGASSSGGFSTKLNGTWGLYAGGTGPSLHNGPVIVSASSQMPALRVTQGGSGYALIVEDAANPDTSAFIISNAGDLAINTNKFTVAAASGNTVIAGTTSLNGNVTFATDATYDIGASGATRPRDLFLSRNLVVGGTLTLAGGVNLNGNVTIGDASTDTLTINSTITSNLIFTDNTYDIGASGATRPRNLFLAGNATIGGAQTLTGALTVDSTTDSTSTTTGSIQTDGGVGIAKALYVGTTANIAGAATLASTLTLSATNGLINSGTTDGSDNKTITISGGGANSATRGANFSLSGNESTTEIITVGGDAILQSGNSTGAAVYIYQGTAGQIAKFSATGAAITGTLSSSGSATINGTSLDINPSSGNPNISLRTGNTYRGYIEGNSGGLTLGAGPAATTILQLATTGASVTGTGSFTGDVTLGNSVAATNVSLNLNGVASKAKRIVFKSSGAEQWLIGQGAASETSAFEIYNGNGTMALAFNKTTSNGRFEGNIELYNSVGTYSTELKRLEWYNTANNYDTASIRGYVGVGQINRGELGFFVNNGGGQQNAMYILDTQYILMTGGTTSTVSGARLQIQTPSGQTNAIDLITTGGTTNNGGSLGMFSNAVYLSSNWYYAGSQYKRIAANASSSITLGSGTTNADGYIAFSVGTTAATAPIEIARFNSDYQLLIGVTTASSTNPKLYVSSTTAFPSWSETTAIAGSAFRATTTGTTNNIILWNNSNYGYGIVGVNSATTGSSGGDVFSLGYTNSAGAAATPVFSWNSSGNAYIGVNTTAPTGVASPFINKFDRMGAASTNSILECVRVITDNTATTILTVADSTKWAGTILISYVRDVDQNRSGMKMVRFAYNQTFTTLLDSSQNSGCTFSVSGNNIQVTIGGSGQYYCQIQIWGGAGTA